MRRKSMEKKFFQFASKKEIPQFIFMYIIHVTAIQRLIVVLSLTYIVSLFWEGLTTDGFQPNVRKSYIKNFFYTL